MRRQKSDRGFTLVELLVVLATLAILALVLFPAMAQARVRSALDICLNHQKQFSVAWVMFGADHADYMVSANQLNNTNDSLFSWRIDPNKLSSLPGVPANDTAQRVFDNFGFRAGGLYPYVRNDDVIHCPADTRYLSTHPAWCTYSMVDNMNGGAVFTSGTDFRVHKTTEVKSPGARMILTEENEGRNEPAGSYTVYENEGSWVPYRSVSSSSGDAPNPTAFPKFSTMKNGGQTGWWDGPAAFHAGGATFSFCDGHAEFHRWRNTNTLKFSQSTDSAKSSGPYSYISVSFAGEPDDLTWLYSRIATPFWP